MEAAPLSTTFSFGAVPQLGELAVHAQAIERVAHGPDHTDHDADSEYCVHAGIMAIGLATAMQHDVAGQ